MDLGANKHYICGACTVDIDRDLNGAVNIYKKFCGLFI